MSFIGGFLVTLAAQVGVGLASAGLVRAVPTGDRRLDILWWWIVRWVLLSAGVVTLGAFGLLTAGPLFAFAAVAGIGGLLLLRNRPMEALRWPAEVRDRVRAWWALASFQQRAFAGALALFSALSALRLALTVWFVAPYGGDETWYHLPRLAHWVQTGTLERPSMPDLRGYFPAGMQVLQVWWVAFLHHDVVIELASVDVLLFGLAAAFTLARFAGFAAPRAVLTSALFGSVPIIAAQAGACANDIAISMLILAVLAFALREGPRLRDAGFILCMVWLAMSIKPTIVYVLPAVALLLWRRQPATGADEGVVRPVRIAILGLAASVGIYWYLRNMLDFGNPLYPAGLSVFGWMPFNEDPGIVLIAGDESRQQTWPALESLVVHVNQAANTSMHDAYVSYNHTAWKQMGWGWFGMAMGLPMLVPAVRSRQLPWRLLGAGALTCALTFTFLQPDLWTMRFISWACVFVCMAIAAVLPDLTEVPRRILGYLLCLCTALNLLGVTFVDGMVPNHVRSSLAHSWRTRSGSDFMHESALRIDTEHSIAVAGTAYPAYTLYGPDLSRRVTPIRFGSVHDLTREMERADARFLVVGNLQRSATIALRIAVEQRLLIPINEDIYERVIK